MGIFSTIGGFLQRTTGLNSVRTGAYGDSNWNAASQGREQKDWVASSGSADADNLHEADVITQRSRDLQRNEPAAEAILDTHAMSMVGTGLRPIPDPDYIALGWTKEQARAWARQMKSRLRLYYASKDPDINGQNSGYFLQFQIAVAWMASGGLIILPHYVEDTSRSTKYGTTFQLIEIDQLSNPFGLPNSDVMRDGVELDPVTKKPIALHIQDQHPGDDFMLAGGPPTWTRVPLFTPWGRRQAIHVFETKRIGQHRGIAMLAPFMSEFKTLSDYKQAELQATLNNALVAAFVKSGMPMEQIQKLFQTPQAYLEYRQRHAAKLKPGAVIPMALGDELSAFLPGRPNQNFTAFWETVLRQGTASARMPMEIALKDFSKSNYSNTRAALIEFMKSSSTMQRWLIDWACDPMNELVLEEMVHLGDMPDPLTGMPMEFDTFYDNFAALTRTRWIGPAQGYIDVTKEADAQGTRMGEDYEELLDQIEMEAKDLAARGLQHPAFAERPPTQSPTNEEVDARDNLERNPKPSSQRPDLSPVGTTPMETPIDAPLPQ
jgi:lambda family phage portal protein